ncbi:MAG: dienelactone hydrolase family protein [Anaerolineales bacterium]|jgi:predicted esterase
MQHADNQHPHNNARLVQAGVPLEEAKSTMLLLHGRGSNPEDILSLTPYLEAPDWSFLAPQASGYTWYPYSFLAPREQNEPYLSSALRLLEEIFQQVAEAGIPAGRVFLLGFSQGACLASEFAARNPRPYAGLAALSGGLVGEQLEEDRYTGSLAGVPVFLGCSDIDPHIPKERVQESEQILAAMGARVTARLYPGMGHTIIEDEINFVQQMIDVV